MFDDESCVLSYNLLLESTARERVGLQRQSQRHCEVRQQESYTYISIGHNSRRLGGRGGNSGRSARNGAEVHVGRLEGLLADLDGLLDLLRAQRAATTLRLGALGTVVHGDT